MVVSGNLLDIQVISPTEVMQYDVARNLHLAALGATIWDILIYIPDDIRIIRKGFSFVTTSFVFSRVFALAYVILSVLSKVRSIDDCRQLQLSNGAVCILSITCSSFLLLRRLQAVYNENRYIRWTFVILWLATCCIGITVLIGVHSTHIPGTHPCVVSEVKGYVVLTTLMSMIFDTLVFLAISYKLLLTPPDMSDGGERCFWCKRVLLSARGLPRVSRAVLQGGQQYYLITISVNILLGIFLYVPTIPVIYKAMFAVISVPLTASMASRVFRNLRMLDLTRVEEHTISEIDFARVETRGQKPPNNNDNNHDIV